MTYSAQNKVMDEQAFEKFVEDLMKEKNNTYESDQMRKEVKENLMRELSDALNKKLLDELSDDQIDELNKLLDEKASDEKVSGFFASKLPNMQQLLTEALLDFRKGYLSVVYNPHPSQTQAPASPPPLSPAPVGDVDKKVN